MVRMGEYRVSRTAGEQLITIGLGSCIGLAMIDRDRDIAGLAHIVLPDSKDAASGALAQPTKFADTAVPKMLDELARMGARRSGLVAVLVGGAQMFAFGSGGKSTLDIGRRNEAATREALGAVKVPVMAAATGGTKGRTVVVHVAGGAVTVKEAGGTESELWRAGRTR